MSENYDLLQTIASNDVLVLKKKGEAYGDSWCKRGGTGAFMMLARKWDRIENQVSVIGYDIFRAVAYDKIGEESLLDDIQDLRRYLLLVEGHLSATANIVKEPPQA